MADPISTTDPKSTPSVAPLVAGIIDDVQQLIKENLSLFKVEVTQDLKKTRDSVVALGVGVGLLTVGALHLTLMLVFLLWWVTDTTTRAAGLPLWACFGIVGGLFAGIGLALFLRGKKKLESFNPLPDESAEALKENVQWIQKSI